MEKHRKKFSIRLIEKIGHDEEEREIIQYGLHQGFLILLNLTYCATSNRLRENL